MTRGKDKRPRRMHAASLGNLQPWDVVRPAGTDDVLVRVYLPSALVRAWKRLSPKERGELVELALKVRESGGY